ncbi:AAA family ATPase [Nocardia sp. AG03]|uniref:helix-turn-helix transcriptional regulator n=1 Tax=Nocardia sp. AG03 TaxID=3025312 RepID=UPI002418370F|nr:AAA family ATPase [Nocardia sp. AG03]
MLHGRDAEQARIDDLLTAARAGRSGALVLRGEAGIGKSALLDYAAAQGLPTARSAGIESEAELPFAALHLLIRPGMALVPGLPPRQREALEAAFGLGDGTPADRMLIGLAVLTLLAEEAADGPLLCLIDDAHWLDRASAEALLFAARRLDAEGVVMVFATRSGPEDFPAPGLPELVVPGLRPEAAAALLDAGPVRLSPTDRYRLLSESGGNPLALLELPSTLGATTPTRAHPLALTQRLQLAFHGRVTRLPAATRTVLLVAATAGSPELAPVLRAADTLGVVLDDLQPAQDAELVRTDGAVLTWRHPLLRAAVYQGSALTQRLAAHRALAAAFDTEDTADLHAWHRACAATGPDETTATLLERTAERARRRHGFHGAVAAYERAAALGVTARGRSRRLALAAEMATEAGLTDQAVALAERAAAPGTDSAVELRLALVRAQADFAAGVPASAHRRLLAAAIAARTGDPGGATRTGDPGGEAPPTGDPAGATRTGDPNRATPTGDPDEAACAGDPGGATRMGDPGMAARILTRAVHAAWYLGPAEIAEVAEVLATLPLTESDPVTPIARYLITAVAGHRTVDLRTAAALARANGADSPADLVQLCGSGLVVGQDEQVGELAEELIGECREQGRIGVLAPLLFFRSEAQLFAGRPGAARVGAEEGLRIAEDLGQAHWVGQLSAFLAYLAAQRGDEDATRARAERATAEEFGGARAVGASWAHAALGLLALGQGRLEAARAELAHMSVEPARHHVSGLRALPDRIEVAVRLGATEDATAALDDLTAWAERADQEWITALVACGRALLADGPEAETHFVAALAANRPFDEARTRLLYGEWLRREKRKVDARTQLEQALAVFDRLEAGPWRERARTELSALGVGTVAAASAGPLSLLTPQESQIVRLAARGLSNREIAARLFLSHRTVGHHLYKAYPKLGVLSRGELKELELGE